jgi:hypothetical protein
VAKQPAKGRKTTTKAVKAAGSPAKATESAAEGPAVVDAIPPEVHAKAAPKATPAKKEHAPKSAVPPVSKPKPATPTPPSTPTPTNQGRFMPLVLGGLVAGVIGFAVATFTAPAADTTLASQVAAQSGTISALSDRIDGIPATDLSAIEAQIVDLEARIAALEAQPAPVAAAPSGDVAGVAADMDALRAQIAEMTAAAQTELAAARAEADAIEENAVSAARNAAGRAALARVQVALESGAPIGAALTDLEDAIGADAPSALVAAHDGVPTLASLQQEFPEAARAALATARSEGVAGEQTTGLGAFLRTQLDVRSTAPREGDGADAVLSRAEDAIRNGRLSDALAEISALPEVARAEMSGWLAQAELRASAVDAVEILSTSLSDN